MLVQIDSSGVLTKINFRVGVNRRKNKSNGREESDLSLSTHDPSLP